jgi:hypothetical protein
MPKKALRRDILRLHITYCNSHNPAVGQVIDMESHGCPPLDTLDMVKHDPNILQITVWLHSPDKVNSRPRAHLEHLKYIEFLQQLSLASEFVFLHIGSTAMTFESGDAVNDPPSPNALEGSDCVTNTRGAEVLVPVHDKFHGLQVHNFIGIRSRA